MHIKYFLRIYLFIIQLKLVYCLFIIYAYFFIQVFFLNFYVVTFSIFLPYSRRVMPLLQNVAVPHQYPFYFRQPLPTLPPLQQLTPTLLPTLAMPLPPLPMPLELAAQMAELELELQQPL
jgi:hypothetical protein